MKKSSLLHLRIPFSFFLLPVFLFAWAIQPQVDGLRFWIALFLIHVLFYPAINGYNSYFDKDEESIGGLKHPPKVSLELYYISLGLDIVCLLVGYFYFSWEFAVMLFVMGLASKAYSHPAVRLKSKPIGGWITAGFFQGYFTFLMTYVGLHQVGFAALAQPEIQIPAILSTALLFGSYPMTQIYQHEEDRRRGDITISIKLGILNTFHFTAAAFFCSTIAYISYFSNYSNWNLALLFLLCLSPVLVFFAIWYFQTRKDLNNADFERTMRLNLLSGFALNIFFLLMGLLWG